MKINLEKLGKTIKKNVPNTENMKYPQGFLGYFEQLEGYNKLVAYAPQGDDLKFSWVHKEYQS